LFHRLEIASPVHFFLCPENINSFINSSSSHFVDGRTLPFVCIIALLHSCTYSEPSGPPKWHHPPYYEVPNDLTSTFAPDAPFELDGRLAGVPEDGFI
jgi:hypothetical protein